MHGADPEFVILDINGKPVPAHKVGVGGKDAKHKVPGGQYFRDGYNLEINPGADSCRANFGNNTRALLKAAQRSLPTGYTLSPRASFVVDLDELKDAPTDVVEFGCNPSFDAWHKGKPKVVSLDGRTFSRRMTGGHLHLTSLEGSDEPWAYALRDPEMYPVLVQKFDEFLGVPLAVIYNSQEQWDRRRFYGQAGEYRPQRHPTVSYYPEDTQTYYKGVEYRTPPSELFLHHAMVSWAFGVMRWVVEEMSLNPDFRKPVSKKRGTEIAHAINTGEGATDLLSSVPGYYTADTVLALAKQPAIRRFSYILDDRECHDGFLEYAKEWGIKPNTIPDSYWERTTERPGFEGYHRGWTYAMGYRAYWP